MHYSPTRQFMKFEASKTLRLILALIFSYFFAEIALAQDYKIKHLQSKLTLSGFDPGPVDGFWGKRTASALAEMLNTNGIEVSSVSKKDISLLLAAAFIIYGFSQPLLGVFIKLKIAVKSFSLKTPWRHKDLLIFPNLVLIPLPILIYQSLGDVNILYPLILLYAFFAGLCVTPHNHLHLKFANNKRSSLDISYYRTIAQIGKMIAALLSGFIFEYLGIEWNLALSSSLHRATFTDLSLKKFN